MVRLFTSLLDHIRSDDPALYERGLRWYPDAHETARRLAQRYGVETPNVIAVIAVLSPNVRWETNVEAAETVLDAFVRGLDPSSVRIQTYGRNKARAFELIRHPDPASTFNPRTCPKVHAFFRNILDPSDPEPVTIDRHMARLYFALSGEPGKRLTYRRYQDIANLIREASRLHGAIPSEGQAVLWVAWREGAIDADHRLAA